MNTLLDEPPQPVVARTACRRPRLGFLGVGWIGRHRMEAIVKSGAAEVCAIADSAAELAAAAAAQAPGATVLPSLADMLAMELDGIVIATPSALHAAQAVAALGSGKAVFCQKPLGRTAAETRRVIGAARAADRLLGVDLSYRLMTGVQEICRLCRQGDLGELFALDLTFHNAYGPDKPWFYDWRLSGGGCLIDLGIHLVDLALWCLDFPRVTNVSGRMYAQGKPIRGRTNTVEDYAVARLDLETGATVQLACSWKLPAGCDAVIGGSFYGSKGGASFRNLNGSFYHFIAERFQGTKRTVLADAPEEWGGRAAADWNRRLAAGAGFDQEVEGLERVASTLDAIYDSAGGEACLDSATSTPPLAHESLPALPIPAAGSER